MNELFDKLVIRIVFTMFICLLIYLYKQIHWLIHPEGKRQLKNGFFPTKNPADTLILFSKILGIAIIFSNFQFHLSDGIIVAVISFIIQSLVAFLVFLGSCYIIESIVLYNFEYEEEIIRRKNYAYATISATHTIVLAFVIQKIIFTANESISVEILLWSLAITILGLATKFYSSFSILPFNRLMVQKNMALALSYSGYFWGWGLIVTHAFNNPTSHVKWYFIQIILKIALSLIIFPIFKMGLTKIFRIKLTDDDKNISNNYKSLEGPALGIGIYEGAIILGSFILTIVISYQIDFGSFYPTF